MVDPVVNDHPAGLQDSGADGARDVTPANGQNIVLAPQMPILVQSQQETARRIGDVVLYNRFWRPYMIRRHNLERVTRMVWLLTTILEQLFAVRFVLKLIAANPAAGFAQFIYGLTGVFLRPFFGLTGSPVVEGSVFETFTLIAMVAYALTAWAVTRGLWIVFEEPAVQ